MAGEKRTGIRALPGWLGERVDQIKSQGLKKWDTLSPAFGKPLALASLTILIIGVGAHGVPMLGEFLGFFQEKLDDDVAKDFWRELHENKIVSVPYSESHGSTITPEVLKNMYDGHGFDVEYNDKTSGHWEIVKDSEGKIDLKRLDFETGTGPVLHENSAEAIENNNRWSWSHANAGRDISPADYEKASEYFKANGFHPYKVGESIKDFDALLAAVKVADTAITEPILKEILARGGHFVVPSGTSETGFEVWFGPDGKPELHQIPVKDSFPRVVFDKVAFDTTTRVVRLENSDLSPIPLKAK